MKIIVNAPIVKGDIKIEKNGGGDFDHPVIVDLKIPVKRVAKFKDYDQATKAAWAVAAALGEGPYPGECELRRVSSLLEDHLGIVPDDFEE